MKNPHIRSALGALALTTFLAAGMFFSIDRFGAWLSHLVSTPALPGFYLAVHLGLRGGPDGLPHLGYVFALTFLFWWLVFDLGLLVVRLVRVD